MQLNDQVRNFDLNHFNYLFFRMCALMCISACNKLLGKNATYTANFA